MNHLARLGLLTVALAAASAPLWAAQWKWRDAAGSVQYSDRPPPAHVADKDILERPRNNRPTAVSAPVADAASDTASAATKPAIKSTDPQLEAKKRKAEEEEAAKKKAEDSKQSQARAENCQRARNYEKSLKDGIRISRTNDKGEREILDDQGRASEMNRTREAIASNCR